jgi:hypothetical protein
VVPVASLAYRTNLFSAVAAAAAVAVLYGLLRSIGLRQAVAAATVLTFAFTPTFWSRAVIAEVYTLHVLLVASILACLAQWRLGGSNRWLLGGLGLIALSFATWRWSAWPSPGRCCASARRRPVATSSWRSPSASRSTRTDGAGPVATAAGRIGAPPDGTRPKLLMISESGAEATADASLTVTPYADSMWEIGPAVTIRGDAPRAWSVVDERSGHRGSAVWRRGAVATGVAVPRSTSRPPSEVAGRGDGDHTRAPGLQR